MVKKKKKKSAEDLGGKFPKQPDLLSAMNLLNSRLSKGQVKHRLRKKPQEECAVRVTEALGHQGRV